MMWKTAPLARLAQVNPRDGEWRRLPDDAEVSFIPMASISDRTASIERMDVRRLGDVRKGYTQFREGDVLFAKITPCMENGKAALAQGLIRGLGFGSTEFHVLRARPGIEPRFLFHFIRQQSFRDAAKARMRGAAGQQRVPEEFLAEAPFPIVAPSEQRRIVELLDEADRLRRLRAEADAKADRILTALFLETFGDPSTNPKGWRQRPIGDMGNVQTGNTPSRKVPAYYGADIDWIKSDNINTPSHFLTRAAEGLSEKGRRVGRTTPKGSTLVTCIAGSPDCIGNAAMAQREVAFNQQINAVAPHPAVDPYFLYAHFVVGKRLIQAASTGAMKGMVSKRRFSSIMFLDPPPELQEQFGTRCAALCEHVEVQRRAGVMLESLFAVLLYRAFSGSLTAFWRESHMNELLREMEHARHLADTPPEAQI